MTWATILASFMKLFSAVVQAIRDKQLMDAGQAKARADTAEKTNAAIVDKSKINADVGGLTNDQLADELRKWSKDGANNQS